MRSPAYWPFALCSLISITSKYVLRVKGRHIWNPSNFGVSAILFLAGDVAASLSIQWGNFLAPMLVIWGLGAAIIWRLRRFHITGTYVVSFIAFAFLRAWMTGSPWQSEICAHHRTRVSAVYLLYDHRSEDHGQQWNRTMHRRILRGARRDAAALEPGHLRSVLCALPGWTGSASHRNVDTVPPAKGHYFGCMSERNSTAFLRKKNLNIMMQRIKFVGCIVLLAVFTGCKQKPSEQPAVPSQPESRPVQASAPSSTSPAQPSTTANARPSGPIQFTDVTAQAGISFKHNSGAFGKKYLPETMGSGACFLDYDNDGWQDILIVNSMDWPEHKSHKSYPALYHNNHDGTFTDVTRGAGLAVEMYGMGCAVGDFDNDGFDDVYITSVGNNHLFRNLGNGKFADVTAKAGVTDPGFSTSAIWFDYDNDGKLDLFVSHYVDWSIATDQYCSLDNKNKSYCTPQLYKGQSATLFHNKGNGVFENVTKRAGLYDPTSKSLGIAMLDYDDDGWMDLFVANDTQPNKLYHNNHDGTFTDQAVIAGVAYGESGTMRAGMGADAGDFDHSGHQGLARRELYQ